MAKPAKKKRQGRKRVIETALPKKQYKRTNRLLYVFSAILLIVFGGGAALLGTGARPSAQTPAAVSTQVGSPADQTPSAAGTSAPAPGIGTSTTPAPTVGGTATSPAAAPTPVPPTPTAKP